VGRASAPADTTGAAHRAAPPASSARAGERLGPDRMTSRPATPIAHADGARPAPSSRAPSRGAPATGAAQGVAARWEVPRVGPSGAAPQGADPAGGAPRPERAPASSRDASRAPGLVGRPATPSLQRDLDGARAHLRLAAGV
jgi:hypothetical protein